MSRPKLLFLVTEDWFFRSHFLPLGRRAIEEGYECVVAARDSGALADQQHMRLINLPFSRRSLLPWEVVSQIATLRALVEHEQPDVIHAIALKPVALLALAHVRSRGRVFAVTGRGYLAVGRSLWTRLVRWCLRRILRGELREARSVLMVENTADGDWVAGGSPLPSSQVFLMPGAGVDPTLFKATPLPQSGPIIVGVVARLIWSKGVDVAVAAVRLLRDEGVDVILRIAGTSDGENPESVPTTEIEHWLASGGVELLGHVHDVSAFWASAHIACLPSRGGEGLPRSLIEAAACGRPIVTTRTPGCADFVGNQEEIGLLVAPNAVESLASALRRLIAQPALMERMGAKGREKVLSGYTIEHAIETASNAWRKVVVS